MTIPHAAMVERAERLLAAVEGMTPGPWEWWTSNSVKRLSAIGDGDVMYSYPHSSGTDIAIREPDMRGITLLRNEAPALIRSLLQALEAERGDAERYRFLRDYADTTLYVQKYSKGLLYPRSCHGEELDAAIDAARTPPPAATLRG